MMATRKGLVKKTALDQYSRPKKGGIIAIKLREDDELVDIVVTSPGDEVVLSTAAGMAIRFRESDARSMGRNTSGVKGIGLVGNDELVGMVVADPQATLLTVTQNGYGKRTPFGPNSDAEEIDEAETSSSARYRTQHRGGKGLRDIKTTDRNGSVVSVARVDDDDEILMMTARGKIQRIRASDISVIGRNTQGVRIMNLDEGDQLAAVVRVPREETDDSSDEPLVASPLGGESGPDDGATGDNESSADNSPFADSDVPEGQDADSFDDTDESD